MENLKRWEKAWRRDLILTAIIALFVLALGSRAVVHHDWVTLWGAIFVVAMVGLADATTYVRLKRDRQAAVLNRVLPRRPTVYVCEEVPDIIAVCPEEHFLLAAQRRNLLLQARILSGEKSPHLRVSPDMMLIFPLTSQASSLMSSFGIGVGPSAVAAYHDLVEDCNIVHCEMFVPKTHYSMASHGRYPISYAVGWELIHGAPPPEEKISSFERLNAITTCQPSR